MVPDWLADGLVGLAGGFIFAFTKLRGDLCEGEDEPTPREIRAAWAQFANYMVTAPLFAIVVTPSAMKKLGAGPDHWVTSPMVATFVGFGANYLWPLLLAATGEISVTWLKGVFKAVFGGSK